MRPHGLRADVSREIRRHLRRRLQINIGRLSSSSRLLRIASNRLSPLAHRRVERCIGPFGASTWRRSSTPRAALSLYGFAEPTSRPPQHELYTSSLYRRLAAVCSGIVIQVSAAPRRSAAFPRRSLLSLANRNEPPTCPSAVPNVVAQSRAPPFGVTTPHWRLADRRPVLDRQRFGRRARLAPSNIRTSRYGRLCWSTPVYKRSCGMLDRARMSRSALRSARPEPVIRGS